MSLLSLPTFSYIPPMTSPIAAALDALADEFELLDDWEERSDANKVRGCASQVWLVTETGADGALTFRGDSDAHIVRGLIAILLRLYSGRPAADILAFDAPGALERLGLTGALSSQRSNGLRSMIERIRRDAADKL